MPLHSLQNKECVAWGCVTRVLGRRGGKRMVAGTRCSFAVRMTSGTKSACLKKLNLGESVTNQFRAILRICLNPVSGPLRHRIRCHAELTLHREVFLNEVVSGNVRMAR